LGGVEQVIKKPMKG